MVLFWLLVQATVAADADVSPLTNIGYVGRGYNQFLGNPHASVVDPGFRGSDARDIHVLPMFLLASSFLTTASVFDVSQYGSGRVTADRRFQTPDGVDAYPALSCDSQFFSTEITDANAFTTALRASVAGDMKMAPFSGNVEYRKIRERTTLARSVFIESTSTCEVYVARIRMFDPPALAGEFVTAVRGLPPQYSNETLQEYNSFLNYFGTHVVVNIALGARLGVLHEFDAVQFARMLGEGVKVKVAANANSGFVFGQVGLGTTFDHQQSDAFQRQRLSVSTFTTGTRLPPNADPDLWLQSAIDDPVPVRYTLVPIAEFVGDALRGEVDRAVATLCNVTCRASIRLRSLTLKPAVPAYVPSTFPGRDAPNRSGSRRRPRSALRRSTSTGGSLSTRAPGGCRPSRRTARSCSAPQTRLLPPYVCLIPWAVFASISAVLLIARSGWTSWTGPHRSGSCARIVAMQRCR